MQPTAEGSLILDPRPIRIDPGTSQILNDELCIRGPVLDPQDPRLMWRDRYATRSIGDLLSDSQYSPRSWTVFLNPANSTGLTM